MEAMTFFFGAENPLSNWHPATFVVNGVRFVNTEQFMMFCKAKMFGDEEIASKIINATTPRDHKALGRQVRGFDEAKWNEKREVYVRNGCYAKFSQNPEMLKFLLETEGTELVEASPYDRIWGVGLAANNPAINDKKNWLGLNLLGNCLMQVREQLLKEHGHQKTSRPMNNTMAYQAQAGDLQKGAVDGFQQVVFINGQVGSIDAQGFFETIVVFTEQELLTYDLKTEQGKINFDWDSAHRAVGSAQVTHQSMTKIGSLPDGRVFFLLRGGVIALPHEKVGDCLPKV